MAFQKHAPFAALIVTLFACQPKRATSFVPHAACAAPLGRELTIVNDTRYFLSTASPTLEHVECGDGSNAPRSVRSASGGSHQIPMIAPGGRANFVMDSDSDEIRWQHVAYAPGADPALLEPSGCLIGFLRRSAFPRGANERVTAEMIQPLGECEPRETARVRDLPEEAHGSATDG